MEFSGTFTLEGATVEEVWLAFSDPYMIKNALPGCQFLVEVDSGDPDDVDFDALTEEATEAEDPPILPDADPASTAVARARRPRGADPQEFCVTTSLPPR